VSLVGLNGCALFSSSVDEARGPEDDYATYAAQKNGVYEAYDELGLSPSRRLTDEERESLEKRLQVRRLEGRLNTEADREQYFNYRPYMESDDDKIAFLSIPTREGRERYAVQQGMYFKTHKFSPRVQQAVSKADIVLGMTKEAVIESWGDPESIEVAGNPRYGNERWHYVEYNSTSEGYQREDREVIFEAGRVAGWRRSPASIDSVRSGP
jgi:hypothetical protein